MVLASRALPLGLALCALAITPPALADQTPKPAAPDPDSFNGTPYADLTFKVDPNYTAVGPAGRYYPPGPMREGVLGYDVEACRVAPDLKLVDCQTVKEQPSGHLFADAAKQMAASGWMTSARPDAQQPHTPEGRVLARVDFKPGGILFGTNGALEGTNLAAVEFTDLALAFFPARAYRHNISGAAVVACRLGADQHFSDCQVRQEQPAGYAFGEAVARMAAAGAVTHDASETQAPQTADGRVLVGVAFQSVLKPTAKPN